MNYEQKIASGVIGFGIAMLAANAVFFFTGKPDWAAFSFLTIGAAVALWLVFSRTTNNKP
jgi:hypothetical protein